MRGAVPQHTVVLTLVALPARLMPSDWSKATTIDQAVHNGGSVIAEALFELRRSVQIFDPLENAGG